MHGIGTSSSSRQDLLATRTLTAEPHLPSSSNTSSRASSRSIRRIRVVVEWRQITMPTCRNTTPSSPGWPARTPIATTNCGSPIATRPSSTGLVRMELVWVRTEAEAVRGAAASWRRPCGRRTRTGGWGSRRHSLSSSSSSSSSNSLHGRSNHRLSTEISRGSTPSRSTLCLSNPPSTNSSTNWQRRNGHRNLPPPPPGINDGRRRPIRCIPIRSRCWRWTTTIPASASRCTWVVVECTGGG